MAFIEFFLVLSNPIFGHAIESWNQCKPSREHQILQFPHFLVYDKPLNGVEYPLQKMAQLKHGNIHNKQQPVTKSCFDPHKIDAYAQKRSQYKDEVFVNIYTYNTLFRLFLFPAIYICALNGFLSDSRSPHAFKNNQWSWSISYFKGGNSQGM
jgi:hypothetical protein